MRLTQRESAVLRLRYGLVTDETMTYADIAEVIGVSKTMAKQIEHRAIRKLKHPSNKAKMIEIQETINLSQTPENW